MKVLIVEDSRTYQGILTSYVKEMGYTPITACNGKEALKAFTMQRPEIILLDINMKGMSGYDVARHIRHLGEEWASWVPIIFLSGKMEDEDIVMAIDAGGDDYLVKPVSQIVLHAKVKAMLRIADQRRKALESTKALDEANKKLEHLIRCDGLTGIANKRFFNEYLERIWEQCMQSKQPIGLLMIDIDHFKLFNDHYGHLHGDRCLIQVAQALNQTVSSTDDIAFRYGGEEFAVILPDCTPEHFTSMGERLVNVVRELKIPHACSSISETVSISIGGCIKTPKQGKIYEHLISLADKKLFQAKETGRNRFIGFRSH